MPRSDHPFARIELDFILVDPRWKALSGAAAKLYITLWTLAVSERTERLQSWHTHATLASLSGLDPRTVRYHFATLRQNCLIDIDSENRIIVNGVRSKHNKLINWKDSKEVPKEPPKGHLRKISTPREKEKEKEKEKDPPVFPPKPTKRKGQIPEGFVLTDALRAYAEGKGIPPKEIQDTFEAFSDHHRARGTVMLDWDRAWYTWVRNDIKFRKRDGRPISNASKQVGPKKDVRFFWGLQIDEFNRFRAAIQKARDNGRDIDTIRAAHLEIFGEPLEANPEKLEAVKNALKS